MKKVFLRILPLAAAVLLATSCSKDESNGDVVENGQETVVKQEKTITVSGKVNPKSGISKTTVSDLVCTYESGERIYIYGDGKRIHGESALDNADGDFTIDIKYPADDDYKLDGQEVTVEIGVQSNEIIVLKNDGTTKNAVFGKSQATIKIVKVGEDWKIQPDGEDADYGMQVEVAFVKNNKGTSIFVKKDGDTGDGVELASGEICVVPAKIKITADGKKKTGTGAGEIYTVKKISANATAPTAKSLTFNGNQNNVAGSAQELINEGKTDGGQWQYKLGADGEYSTAIPTATNAGEYTVYYKLVGGDDYEDIEEQSLTVRIAKAKGFVSLSPSSYNTPWGDDASEVDVSVSHHGGILTTSGYNSNEVDVCQDGNTFNIIIFSYVVVCTITITSGETENYNAASADFNVNQ